MADLDRQRLNLRTILTTFHAAMDSPSGTTNATGIVERAHQLLDRASQHPTGAALSEEIEAVRSAVEARARDRTDQSG